MNEPVKTEQASPLVLKDCTVLGAAGFPFQPGENIVVVFQGETVSCSRHGQMAQFSLIEVADLSVTGPGSVVTGGGFIGGGFGVDGALTGMAIAGVLNALTTQKTVQTFLALTTNFGELHLHYRSMEPAALRIFLSDVYVRLRQLNTQWRKQRQAVIDGQLASGAITEEEAATFQARLLAPPAWPNLAGEAEMQRLKDEAIADAGPKGMCPSCDRIIPLSSEKCRYCKANFGEYASWSVIPVS